MPIFSLHKNNETVFKNVLIDSSESNELILNGVELDTY